MPSVTTQILGENPKLNCFETIIEIACQNVTSVTVTSVTLRELDLSLVNQMYVCESFEFDFFSMGNIEDFKKKQSKKYPMCRTSLFFQPKKWYEKGVVFW